MVPRTGYTLGGTPHLLLVGVVVLAAAVLALPARAETTFGVADDRPKYSADGGAAFFETMREIGLTTSRVTLLWESQNPRAIPERPLVQRMLGQAGTRGIEVVLALYPARASAYSERPSAPAEFAAWAADVARAFPSVRRFVIGNELNQPRFHQPQFLPDCTRASGTAYMQVLARSYDLLKAVDPSLTVITSVSSRGNDTCNAVSNVSTSPYRFIHDMGLAYRALGRTRPVWDEWGLHAYPNRATDSVSRGFQWPNIGLSNLDRLKQALWDAFAGTGQPTFGVSYRPGHALAALAQPRIFIGETGWQARIPAASRHAYFGEETVKPTTEEAQAATYAEIVRRASCDAAVSTVNFFTLMDEPDLARMQTGLMRADGSRRPAFAAVKQAIAGTRGRCAGKPVSWQPTTSVVGTEVRWGKIKRRWWKHRWWGFNVTAGEEATFNAGVFRLPRRRVSVRRRVAIVRALVGIGARRPVFGARGPITAYWSPLVRFPNQRLRPGWYVYAVRVTATMNSARAATLTSRPFRVGPRPRRRGR